MSKHVIIGAGPVGTATALLLAERGEDVVVVTRSGSGPTHRAVTRIAADAASSGTVIELTTGATAVYNCANPAYHRWASDWPPIARALLAGAGAAGSVLATVGNLYGYGPVSGPMTEDHALAATGVKGRTRAAMWREALAAHDAGRVRVTEVRGSDYLVAGSQSHVGDRVVPRLLAGKGVAVVGSADVVHTWTAVADVARLLVTVADDERGWGRAWHVPSNPPRTQREVISDLCVAAGVDQVKVSVHPPLALRLLGLVNPMVREFAEVSHQFTRPFVLDSSDAERTFALAPTPWQDAVTSVIDAYRTPAEVR